MVNDQIDMELLHVFIEEGKEAFPKLSQLLRQLGLQQSDDAQLLLLIKRYVHTLKGSARMVGAMRLGQCLHECEEWMKSLPSEMSLSEEDMTQGIHYYDECMRLFDSLIALLEEKNHAQQDQLTQVLGKKESSYIRIPSSMLDHLLNQVGEIAIVRSYVENEAHVLQQVIQELALHIEILDKKVRDVQMQSGMHMRTLWHQEHGSQFDWLEFDQFTYMHELTHKMVNRVSDISALRKHLMWTMRHIQTHITSQTRLTKDLQSDLMSIRMEVFLDAEDRLQRLVRQVGRETQKHIALTMEGGDTRIDRQILTTMTVVFEHLIRNAIVHGLEPPAERLQLGKPEVGHIRIIVRQEGREIVIHFVDDGQGIHLPYVKERAVALGVIASDANMTVDDVLDVIAHPHFSASKNVTELAGRGVGMDIVCAEVAKLGGRIQLKTENQVGTTFTMHLPMTLTTMRIVLVMVASHTYAIPLNLVRQVARKKDVRHVLDDGREVYQWQGKDLSVARLDQLLLQSSWSSNNDEGMALILKNDADNQVLLVDIVLGNQEVIVKQLEPVWVKVDGVLGATILGDGQVVMIVQPNILIQKYMTHRMQVQQANMMDMIPPTKVMVVDDALTVRRVLKKMLDKEGYVTFLAKDGQEALLQIPIYWPDIILLDVEMPRMDGFRLLKKIRANAVTRDIPVIMLTSRTATKHQRLAQELGADAYMGKPYQKEALLALMSQLLASRQSTH